LDRIDCRRRDGQGSDFRVVAELRRADATVAVTDGARRSSHTVPRARFDEILAALRSATASPIAGEQSGGDAVGYEITFSGERTQSSFRWIAATPAGWESVAAAADALLAIARELSPPA
jgi:hypothetical protein